MKVTTSESFNVTTLEDLQRFTSIFANQIGLILNANLNFRDNFLASTVTYAFTLANTTIGLEHKLGVPPTGYIMVSATAAMAVFDGNQANTDKILFLQSNAIGTAKVLVF